MAKTDLAVGDSTALEIIFSTKRYTHRVTKRPRIETNEGPPHKYVQIIADVVRRPDSTYPLVFKPYKLDISQFGEKVRDKMKFTIKNVSDQDVEITPVFMPPDYVDVSLPKNIPAGKTSEAVLTLRKDAINKSFDRSFTIEVNDQAKSRFTVPIKRTLRLPTPTPSVRATADSLRDTVGRR